MKSTEDTITGKQFARILSESKARNISKGIVEDLSYNMKDSLSVTKTGKEFKVLLTNVKNGLAAECEEKKARLTVLLSLVSAKGITPAEYPSSYNLQGIRKAAFSYIPKMFSYEQRYQENEVDTKPVAMGGDYSTSDLQSVGVKSPLDKGTRQNMSNYNDCARSYIRKSADKIFLEALIGSIKDSQSVKLTGTTLKLLV